MSVMLRTVKSSVAIRLWENGNPALKDVGGFEDLLQ